MRMDGHSIVQWWGSSASQIALDKTQRLPFVRLMNESVNVLVAVRGKELHEGVEERFVLADDCNKLCKAKVVYDKITHGDLKKRCPVHIRSESPSKSKISEA